MTLKKGVKDQTQQVKQHLSQALALRSNNRFPPLKHPEHHLCRRPFPYLDAQP
jgi:hypothetical protein